MPLPIIFYGGQEVQLFLQITTIFYKLPLLSTNHNFFHQTTTFFYKAQLFFPILQLFST